VKAILLEELIDNTDAETSQIGGDNLADRTGTHALTVVKTIKISSRWEES